MMTPDNPQPPGTPWPTAAPGADTSPVRFPEMRTPDSTSRRVGHRTLFALLLAGLAALSLILVIVAVLAPPSPAPYCQPLKCQGPPIGHPNKELSQSAAGSPIVNGVVYRNGQGFSLEYQPNPSQPSIPEVATNASSIQLTWPLTAKFGGNGYLIVGGQTAGQLTAQGLVEQVVSNIAPSAQPVYEMPEPLVGFTPGFGEAFDVQPSTSDGSTGTNRMLVVASVQNGFGVVVIAEGSLLANITPNSPLWNGHASPADVNVAYLADPIVNSIRFP